MYALLVFTLGWPAPEPINTYPRIEVCQAVKMRMVSQLSEVEGFAGLETKELKCVQMAALEKQAGRRGTIAAARLAPVE